MGLAGLLPRLLTHVAGKLVLLLVGGLSYPHTGLSKAASVASQRAGWPPLEPVIWGRGDVTGKLQCPL